MRLQLWLALGMSLAGCFCFRPVDEPQPDAGGTSGGGGGEVTGGGGGGSLGGGTGGGSTGGGSGGGTVEFDAGSMGGCTAAPDIEVTPSTLDLGRVAYFPNATPPSFTVGTFTIRNAAMGPPDSRCNLKLNLPQFSVMGIGASPSEICVGMFDEVTNTCVNTLANYDPSVGLAPGSELAVPVRVTPDGLGTRAFNVSIYSNDPTAPATTIRITVNAVALPPCSLSLNPPSLDFGVMSSGTKELALTLTNQLTGPNDLCSISNLQISPPTSGISFSLLGAAPNFDLQPGETRVIPVRATVTGVATSTPLSVTTAVGFTVADPISPSRGLPILAILAQPCLVISPPSYDFGTVARNCASASASFQLFNICATDVVIDSASVPPLEFSAITTGLSPGTHVSSGAAPLGFSVKYRPVDLGVDRSTFVLAVTERGQPLRYTVPLTGTGSLTGAATESFSWSTRPKADVLLVIDDSCSMSDKQTLLAQGLNSLLAYARFNSIDFHIGVTNTELSGTTAAQAGLLHATSAGTKILTPLTPNLNAEFSELVNVGTAGAAESCAVPATRALTPPYSIDPAKNAGFLRNDASLAVICFTDARDQAPLPPSYYANQLSSIKGKEKITYSVMGPFTMPVPFGCDYDDPNTGYHAQMVTQLNGVMDEICVPNWTSPLSRLGTVAFGNNVGTYFLTSRPDVPNQPIEVRIDGVTIPELTPSGMDHVWTYDALKNAVTFAPLYLPQPGQTVTISYTGICYP